MLSRILIIAMLSAAIAFAQRGGGGMPNGPAATDAGGWGSAHADALSPRDRFAAKLKLDKQQRTAVEAILNAAQEAMEPAQRKLTDARKDLVLAMLETPSNPDAVAKLTAAYTALSVEAKTVETTAFGKICALLKPNQQSKAVSSFALMAQLVEHGQMGAPAGGAQPGQWGRGYGGQR
jgi:Spy/CpxP family protein refolding chaperone